MVSTPPDKKGVPLFRRKEAANTLEQTVSQNFSPGSPKNALELARALCVLANAGEANSMQSWFNVLALLRVGWQPELDERAWTLYSGRKEDLVKLAASAVRRGFEPRFALTLGAIAAECVRLSVALGILLDKGCTLVERPTLFATLDNSTGKVLVEEARALGPYHDALVRVLEDPRIDKRRFRRCEACRSFYYQPRLRSRACSKKCENVLLARTHYRREKDRRQTAHRLRAEGQSMTEIAKVLGVKIGRVRRYIKGRES
jgi:hypothetical protein